MIERFNQWVADGGLLEPQILIPMLITTVVVVIALSIIKRR